MFHVNRKLTFFTISFSIYLLKVEEESKSVKSQPLTTSKSEDRDRYRNESDPVLESYRSIIQVINETSNGFKEGKKWKCVYDNKANRSSRTMSSENCDRVLNRAKARRLVRQKAEEFPCEEVEIVDETHPLQRKPQHLQVKKGLPTRQWTVDACTGIKSPVQETLLSSMASGSTAYLLRPVSRNSVHSTSGATSPNVAVSANVAAAAAILSASVANEDKRASPSDHNRPKSPYLLQKSPVRERIRLADISKSTGSSFNHSTESAAGARSAARIYERALQPHLHHPNRRRLQKQRTSESAPQAKALSGSSRNLPRQHSNASAYSVVMPTSYSHQGITLVRGASCSLVDIPTYLGPSVAGGVVEVAQLSEVSTAAPTTGMVTKPIAHQASTASTVSETRKPSRPRLQLDLTKKKNNDKNEARKTQWTVLCVSLTLLTLAVTLVGTMLSVGSQYQEMVIAKQWETITKRNQSSRSSNNKAFDNDNEEEPFVIVPDTLEDMIDMDNQTTSTSHEISNQNGSAAQSNKKTSQFVPIIFPPDSDTKTLLGLTTDLDEKIENMDQFPS